jgi:hypothetical protein
MTKMLPTPPRARCYAVLTPMTPPPMIITEACEGSGSVGPGSLTELLPRSNTVLLVKPHAHEWGLLQRDRWPPSAQSKTSMTAV